MPADLCWQFVRILIIHKAHFLLFSLADFLEHFKKKMYKTYGEELPASKCEWLMIKISEKLTISPKSKFPNPIWIWISCLLEFISVLCWQFVLILLGFLLRVEAKNKSDGMIGWGFADMLFRQETRPDPTIDQSNFSRNKSHRTLVNNSIFLCIVIRMKRLCALPWISFTPNVLSSHCCIFPFTFNKILRTRRSPTLREKNSRQSVIDVVPFLDTRNNVRVGLYIYKMCWGMAGIVASGRADEKTFGFFGVGTRKKERKKSVDWIVRGACWMTNKLKKRPDALILKKVETKNKAFTA